MQRIPSNVPSNNSYYSRQLWAIEASGVNGKYKMLNEGNYLENGGGNDKDLLSNANDQGRVLCSNNNAPNSQHYPNQLWKFEIVNNVSSH